jgi:hypothetical protein
MTRRSRSNALTFAGTLALLALAPAPTSGTTYVPVSDQALVDRAAVIGTFEVVSVGLAPTALVTTEYQVRVQSLLKGDLPSGTALVRVLGGEGRGTGLRITGMPSFLRGERDLLLFLVPRQDGTWGIAHVLMGAFHSLERSDGVAALVRPQMEDATSVGGDGSASSSDVTIASDRTMARDRARFLDWIADRVAGNRRSADYYVQVDPVLAARFTLMRDRRTGLPVRWFDFDSGHAVTWRSSSQGAPGYADGGVASLQEGLAAWSNQTQTPIELLYSGQGPVDGGFDEEDGVNTILYGDPHDTIDAPYDCSTGGVIAIGGPWYTHDVLPFDGQSWHPAREAAVIVNANVSCYLRNDTTRLSGILAHELGHTLGLGHSCGDSRSPSCASSPEGADALMRASLPDDGRGARLGSDDVAGARAIYGSASGASGTAEFGASAFYGSEETHQAVVRLERKGGKSGELSARLRTSDLSATAPLDYATMDEVVVWADDDDAPKLVTIPIQDDASAEDGELLEVLLETASAVGQSSDSPLAAATVAIADDDGSPVCVVSDRHLCLLGDRFKVEVEWRNQRNVQRGFGHAIDGSDQSGYFWFFQHENVELVVKAFDGRAITGAHWVFYGALSDVEYWVTVTDTTTGAVKLYRNEPGNICGMADTSAFPEVGG